MAKETKKAEDAQVAPGPTATAVVDWNQWQGTTGLENVRQEDLGLPFLAIAQSNSPELKKTDPKHIRNLEQGDVFNTLTREILYKQGQQKLMLIPCAYDRLYMEWVPRNKGGGLVKSHRDQAILAETTRNVDGRDELKNGNIIVTTAYFFCMIPKEGGKPDQVVIGLSSTQLKKCRQWLNLAMAKKMPNGNSLPLFSHRYALGTAVEKNEEGEWFGWTVEIGDMVNDQSLVTAGSRIAQTSIASVNKLSAPADEAKHY